MPQAGKLYQAGFPQTGCPTAQRGDLYRQTNGRNSGKKSRQLFRAALLLRDKRWLGQTVSRGLTRPGLQRQDSRDQRDAGTRKNPQGREARLAPKEMSVGSR